MISLDDLRAAQARIEPFIHHTPLVHSRSLSMITGAEIFVKAENLQKTGAFKVRGAFNKMIGLGSGRVITASMGNHAQAVAFAARETGIEARIIMPVTVPIVKEEACKAYGAEVILHGDHLRDALDYAVADKDHTFIHPFDDDRVMAGQGTIGLEILEELSHVDYIVAPVGGGGLIAGIAVAAGAVSPGTVVVGVQSESAPAGYRSFHGSRITAVSPVASLADGISVARIGRRPMAVIRAMVNDILLVQEDSIALAILLLMERMKLVVEGAGATPLAAVLSHKERFRGKRVVLVASGGNIDFTIIDRIIRKGLFTNGRIAVIEVLVDDTPGSLRNLSGIIADHRANILDVTHDRLTGDVSIGKTLVAFTVEVRSKESLKDLLFAVRSGGFTARNLSAPPRQPDKHANHRPRRKK